MFNFIIGFGIALPIGIVSGWLLSGICRASAMAANLEEKMGVDGFDLQELVSGKDSGSIPDTSARPDCTIEKKSLKIRRFMAEYLHCL